LERFITVGVDEETQRAIEDLPRGRGVLGVLISEPQPGGTPGEARSRRCPSRSARDVKVAPNRLRHHPERVPAAADERGTVSARCHHTGDRPVAVAQQP
jgi:hypothetical protein